MVEPVLYSTPMTGEERIKSIRMPDPNPITWEKTVKGAKTQLIDALIES